VPAGRLHKKCVEAARFKPPENSPRFKTTFVWPVFGPQGPGGGFIENNTHQLFVPTIQVRVCVCLLLNVCMH